MDENLLTVVSYTYQTEAYVLVAKLEAENIKCFLKNEHTLATQQFLSNAVGGLDVQVRETDFARAKEIYLQLESEKKQSEASSVSNAPPGYEKVLVYCPQCESSEVYRKRGSFFSLGSKEHICLECNHRWKQ